MVITHYIRPKETNYFVLVSDKITNEPLYLVFKC